MKTSTWALLAAALLGCGLVNDSVTAADQADELDGLYSCIGDNGDGKDYEGTVKISKTGSTYEITWEIGGAKHVGVGFIENDRLCCSYAFPTSKGVVTGLVVYKMEKNKLTGRYTSYPGNGKILTETLAKKK